MTVESGTRIVVAGGQSGSSTFFNDVWISDVGGVNWIELTANAPWAARAFLGLVNIGEKLSVFAGGTNTQYYNDSQSGARLTQRTAAA